MAFLSALGYGIVCCFLTLPIYFVGYFCPAGTIELDQFPCSAGTYGTAEGLTSADECEACPASYICPLGTADFGKYLIRGQLYSELPLQEVNRQFSGPGCSKLTTSLVNKMLKFQTLISNMPLFFVEKM